MNKIEQHWYGKPGWLLLLAPLSLLFLLMSQTRRALYTLGIKQVYKADVPVIVVGNIGIGGTGKTPVVIWLAQYLIAKGYQVGVVSRGYGGDAPHYPYLLNDNTTAVESGDEPLLIYKRLNVPVVVSAKRAEAIKLLTDTYQLDFVITDDGLQHYAMARDLEIVVIDGKRRFGNGWLLPVGPLRELPSRLKSVPILINNGGKTEGREHLMQLEPGLIINVKTAEQRQLIKNEKINAIAGIGSPQRFFTTLEATGVQMITQIAFVDHHAYQASDLNPLLLNADIPLLMTEKDAVKCGQLVNDNCWYLPVNAHMVPALTQQIDTWLKEIQCH